MNLIASVLHLDRPAIKALRITDAYSLHRVVYSLYEDVRTPEAKLASVPSGILYADLGGDAQRRKILMLANRPPLQAVDGLHGQVLSKPVPTNLLNHDQYRFQVIVNPTRRNNASRNLIPVRGREAVAEWLTVRALANWGFQVARESLQVDKIDIQQLENKKQQQVTIAQAHVQGVLRVSDANTFKHSFTCGIGRARNHGCGLLRIVPLNNNNRFFD